MGAASGQHHNPAAIAGTTVSTAGVGAAIGTGIAPGIGTAIGAGAGAVAGFLTGLLTTDSPDAPPDPVKPPPPPDLTDEIVRRAQVAKQMREMNAGGTGTFLTGPLGAPTGKGF